MTTDSPTKAQTDPAPDHEPASATTLSRSAHDIASLKAAWRRGLALDASGETASDPRGDSKDPHPPKP